jgi:hypothetical protein
MLVVYKYTSVFYDFHQSISSLNALWPVVGAEYLFVSACAVHNIRESANSNELRKV